MPLYLWDNYLPATVISTAIWLGITFFAVKYGDKISNYLHSKLRKGDYEETNERRT